MTQDNEVASGASLLEAQESPKDYVQVCKTCGIEVHGPTPKKAITNLMTHARQLHSKATKQPAAPDGAPAQEATAAQPELSPQGQRLSGVLSRVLGKSQVASVIVEVFESNSGLLGQDRHRFRSWLARYGLTQMQIAQVEDSIFPIEDIPLFPVGAPQGVPGYAPSPGAATQAPDSVVALSEAMATAMAQIVLPLLPRQSQPGAEDSGLRQELHAMEVSKLQELNDLRREKELLEQQIATAALLRETVGPLAAQLEQLETRGMRTPSELEVRSDTFKGVAEGVGSRLDIALARMERVMLPGLMANNFAQLRGAGLDDVTILPLMQGAMTPVQQPLSPTQAKKAKTMVKKWLKESEPAVVEPPAGRSGNGNLVTVDG